MNLIEQNNNEGIQVTELIAIPKNIYIFPLLHGWVVVGMVKYVDHAVVIIEGNKSCLLRVWGTENGIGELVFGPTAETELDPIFGDMRITVSSIIFSLKVETEQWERVLEEHVSSSLKKAK